MKKITKADADEVLEKIHDLEKLLLKSRFLFPAMDSRMIGRTKYDTAPYYMVRGYSATINLGKPITAIYIEENRRLGKWVNENALIRLYGIMHHHNFFGKIDKTLSNWEEMEILRRMRNAFTKTSLNYLPDEKRNIKLREEVIRHFNLGEEDILHGEIPTPIDKVVMKIFNGCRKYIQQI